MARTSAADIDGPWMVDAVAAGATTIATTSAVKAARGLLAGRRIAAMSAPDDRRMTHRARPRRFTEPRRRPRRWSVALPPDRAPADSSSSLAATIGEAGAARYPVTGGGAGGRAVRTARRIFTTTLTFAIGGSCVIAACTFAGRSGSGKLASGGSGGRPGGSPGVMSPMLSRLPGGASAATRRSMWKPAVWPGPEARDHEAPLAADATQFPVGAHERRSARDLIADQEVASGETATVADGDLIALNAAGGHRGRVGLLVDREVATWWTRDVLVVVVTSSNR